MAARKSRKEDKKIFIFDYVCAKLNFLGNPGGVVVKIEADKDDLTKRRLKFTTTWRVVLKNDVGMLSINLGCAHKMGTQVDTYAMVQTFFPIKGDDHPPLYNRGVKYSS